MTHFELTPDDLLRAYANGMFPMAEQRDDPNLYLFDPEVRGIIPLDSFHVPRRLARRVRSGRFELRIDSAFAAVIEACAEARPGRRETWINQKILGLYGALHERGAAHSVESWRDGKLVGGLYGVVLGGAFFGESMFSREADASKVALVHLVERLRRGGFSLLDTQFLTPHLEIFGAVYRGRLRQALDTAASFHAGPVEQCESATAVS
ncbi:MAG: leucyl/phenylalanyl-tRNA--protein transferase [Proteobacteria bacterium]|nr:leucyl/phenylalanyl-tRNA--protein transferase [Pseudomonadota bacterium]